MEAEVRRGLVHLGDVTLEQLEGLRNRLELRRARRGALVPVLRLRLALRREVREEVLVRRLRVRRLLLLRGELVDLRIELRAHLRLLALGLLLSRDHVAARAALHLERLEGLLLLLVAVHLLLAEILVEILEGRHDLVRVVGVAVRVTLKHRVGLLRHPEGLRESNGLLHHALLREEGLLRTRHEVLRAIDDLGIERRLLRLLVRDRRLQAVNLLVELLDRVLLVVGLLLAEARELVIGLRLRLAVRFDLGLELLKKSRHLLDGVHLGLLLGVSLQGCNERQEENALHGWFTRKLSVTPRKSNP